MSTPPAYPCLSRVTLGLCNSSAEVGIQLNENDMVLVGARGLGLFGNGPKARTILGYRRYMGTRIEGTKGFLSLQLSTLKHLGVGVGAELGGSSEGLGMEVVCGTSLRKVNGEVAAKPFIRLNFYFC